MPPPTSAESWLASRRFGVVIDAGSSGSRVQIYSWKDPKTATPAQAHLLPKVEKGSRNPDDWQYKTEPGISSYYANPEAVADHLRPLLAHARQHVPPSKEWETPLFLLATAGMRLLPADAQAALLKQTCLFLRLHSKFIVEDANSLGPCGNSVRIITGEEEGLFGWIAVNYLLEGFTAGVHQDHTQTYGFLDMGGASAQIAFEPDAKFRGTGKGLMEVHLRTLGGQDIHHQVFVTTWLGYGSNQARDRYVTSLRANSSAEKGATDPCLPKSLHLNERLHDSEDTADLQVTGTGSFSECLRSTLPILNKSVRCGPDHLPTHTCMFNGVSAPPIQFATSHFVGVSEFWYSSEQVFGLGGEWDYPKFEEQARHFCDRDWKDLVKEYSSKFDHLGASRKASEMERLKLQCFKAAWVSNVLHEGIGMPRVVDLRRDKMPPEEANQIRQKPRFQSVDDVNGMSISWTLGKIVLEASKEVKPARPPSGITTARPISTKPATSAPENAVPYRQHSLEPAILLVYAATLLAMVILVLRFRKQLRGIPRQIIRLFPSSSLRLEEGLTRSKPSSFLKKPSWMSYKPKLGRQPSWSSRLNSSMHHGNIAPPVRIFPDTLSNSLPGNGPPPNDPTALAFPSSQYAFDDAIEAHTSSRSSSPVPSLSESMLLSSGQLTPRSRTGSQLGPNSGTHTPPQSRFSSSTYYQPPSSSQAGRVSRVPSNTSLKRDD